MTDEMTMRRLASANPVTTVDPPVGADALFAEIVAAPGDPRLATPTENTRRARQDGRRRSQRLINTVAMAGTAGTVAAAVGVVLLTSGPASHPANHHQIVVGGAHAAETAAIVHKLKGRLAGADALGFIAETTGGGANAMSWTNPQTGVEYAHTVTLDPNTGAVTSVYWSESHKTGTTSAGQEIDSGNEVTLNSASHTYSEGPYTLTWTPAQNPPPGIDSTPQEITNALESGTVSQTGTTTIDGQSAITLSVSGEVGYELDVNASTDQPMRLVLTDPGSPTLTIDLVAATAANTAALQQPQIPSGYTKNS